MSSNNKRQSLYQHPRQPRPSILPTTQTQNQTYTTSTSSHHANSTSHQTNTNTHTNNRVSTLPVSASKSRQLSHLQSQLAQLTAHMSDLENLLRMTAVQAEGMRGLGGYAGGMFMAASKVLGEEAVKAQDREQGRSG